jgi:hypothetical protein
MRIVHALAPLALVALLPARAAWSEPPPRPPEPRPLAELPIPAEESDKPSLDEWRKATEVSVTRRSYAARHCRAYVVREWLKVHCDRDIAAVRQYAGSPKGVLLWVRQRTVEEAGRFPVGGEVILPMRAGDRRIVQFFNGSGGGYEGPTSAPAVIVDESWIEGEASPRVILR